MTAALTLAHRQALLTALVRVRDATLAPPDRGAITALLLGCTEDPDGNATLDTLSAIFEDYDTEIDAGLATVFADLTNACHALGQASFVFGREHMRNPAERRSATLYKLWFKDSSKPGATEHEAIVHAANEDEAYDVIGSYFLALSNTQVVTTCMPLSQPNFPDIALLKWAGPRTRFHGHSARGGHRVSDTRCHL